MITLQACFVTWHAIITRFPITVLSLWRCTFCLVLGVHLPIVSCPIIRRMLYESTISSNISSLVANFPEGRHSTSISVLLSQWYYSHSHGHGSFEALLHSTSLCLFTKCLPINQPSADTAHTGWLLAQWSHNRLGWYSFGWLRLWTPRRHSSSHFRYTPFPVPWGGYFYGVFFCYGIPILLTFPAELPLYNERTPFL